MKTLLVANRGEIALRILRTAKARGLETVAVYTDADAEAPHRHFADRAINIGAGLAGESYLSIETILDAARQSGADAVHPGYGFLSERADFAAAVEAAGLTFIGPPAAAIEAMGNKAAAKRVMQAARVPCIPGYEGDDQSEARFIDAAADLGFPVMVKAAAGGGGRGMRLVHAPADLPDALALARDEARNAFGNDALILERAVLRPRHVEVQVFADTQGQTLHLGERDCSVQRRHQKVVEEAPCPVLTPELRARMGAAAVKAARAVDYVGAGTVEFLLDDSGEFYFLEMNTRLQVEHPVTELITGLDLVALQLDVAEGAPLPLTQDELRLEGHAIEVRLYAEDPANDFLPSAGRVEVWREGSGTGLRIDSGILQGQSISPFYDPMVAKVMAHGPDRETARERLIDGLRDTALFGPANNRDFLLAILSDPAFAAGEATTAFLDETVLDPHVGAAPTPAELALAAVLDIDRSAQATTARHAYVSDELLGWSSAGPARSHHGFVVQEQSLWVQVESHADGRRVAFSDDGTSVTITEDACQYRLDGMVQDIRFFLANDDLLWLCLGDRSLRLPRFRASSSLDATADPGTILAPMHGLVQSVLVKPGERVREGQTLAVLEAMKMQHQIPARAEGRIRTVKAAAAQQVEAGALLFEVEIDA